MMTPDKKRQKKDRIIRINAVTQAKLIKEMLDGVYNCTELAEITGLHYVTVLHYTRELHLAKAAHISGWDNDSKGRAVVKIYRIGKGRDVKRPKMTAAERQARYREKKKFQATIRSMVPVVNDTNTNLMEMTCTSDDQH